MTLKRPLPAPRLLAAKPDGEKVCGEGAMSVRQVF